MAIARTLSRSVLADQVKERILESILSGRYAPVPLADVAEWLDVLARAGVVRFSR